MLLIVVNVLSQLITKWMDEWIQSSHEVAFWTSRQLWGVFFDQKQMNKTYGLSTDFE